MLGFAHGIQSQFSNWEYLNQPHQGFFYIKPTNLCALVPHCIVISRCMPRHGICQVPSLCAPQRCCELYMTCRSVCPPQPAACCFPPCWPYPVCRPTAASQLPGGVTPAWCGCGRCLCCCCWCMCTRCIAAWCCTLQAACSHPYTCAA
jgi:hypothetical protein